MLLYAIYRNGNKKVDKMEKKAQLQQLKSIVIAESGEVFDVEEKQEGEKKEENMKEKEKSDEHNDSTV